MPVIKLLVSTILPLLAAAQVTLPPPISDQNASDQYAALLKRVQQGDLAINFRSFRLAGALMAGRDASMKEQAERGNFNRLMQAGNTQEALDAANQALARDYASLSAHLNAAIASRKLGRPADAAAHIKILNALLDSIQRSGDGLSADSAWFVVTIPEEYVFLATRLSVQRTGQSLVKKDGHAYDNLEVQDPKTGVKRHVWFNTDVDLALYKPAPPRTPEMTANLQRALQFYLSEQSLKALPLIQDLAAVDPEDAPLQSVLADCLAFKADTNVTAAESVALLKQARAAALRARRLGENSARLDELVARLDVPEIRPRTFSAIPDADKAMKEGEQALGTGDYDAALSAYAAALKFDPTLYIAAMYTGEMFFRKKDTAGAAPWFVKAAALNPNSPAVYRHWGDELMLAGRSDEARDKYIEALITLPVPQSWAALSNWASRTNHRLAPPNIDRPAVSSEAPPNADASTGEDDGRSAWARYSSVRAAWRQSIFAEKHPAETQYRHTLEEETAALDAVAAAIASQKPPRLDPQLAVLSELKTAGLLESWILLSGVDAGIARDYAAYRDTHRPQLKLYIEKYVIQTAGN